MILNRLRLTFAVIFFMGIIFISTLLSGCNVIKDKYYYSNAEDKINLIFDNYANSSNLEEEKYSEDEYGDYVELIELQVEYINETEKLFTNLNDSLKELDSIDFNEDFKDLKSDLDEKLEVAKVSLENYSDIDKIEEKHISKMKKIDAKSSNIEMYIDSFKEGNNNFREYDSGYSKIIKKIVEDYQSISDVIESHLNEEIDETKATKQINDFLTDINSVYEEANNFSTDI